MIAGQYMLVSHFNAIEAVLLAQSNAAKNAGHTNLRGGPREWFIRDFLATHLPSNVEVGQGEIIDKNSIPNPSTVKKDEYRPQVDIVVYRQDFPKISYSKTDSAFLVEGVVALIESKSDLTKEELTNACISSRINKSLKQRDSSNKEISSHHLPAYVVAFSGPKQIETVVNWLPSIQKDISASPEELVDMIIVLGKGIIWRLKAFPEFHPGGNNPQNMWGYIAQEEKNLFTMFIHLLTRISATSNPMSLIPYIEGVEYTGSKFV